MTCERQAISRVPKGANLLLDSFHVEFEGFYSIY